MNKKIELMSSIEAMAMLMGTAAPVRRPKEAYQYSGISHLQYKNKNGDKVLCHYTKERLQKDAKKKRNRKSR
jgi:hypothetical protein